jgi:hypothetical protein
MNEINVGIFFDGTNNNRFIRPTSEGAASAETQVSKMFERYGEGTAPGVRSERLYLTGAGTTVSWETNNQIVIDAEAQGISLQYTPGASPPASQTGTLDATDQYNMADGAL